MRNLEILAQTIFTLNYSESRCFGDLKGRKNYTDNNEENKIHYLRKFRPIHQFKLKLLIDLEEISRKNYLLKLVSVVVHFLEAAAAMDWVF